MFPNAKFVKCVCMCVSIYVCLNVCVCDSASVCLVALSPSRIYLLLLPSCSLSLLSSPIFLVKTSFSFPSFFGHTHTHTDTQQYIEKKEMANMVTDHLAEGLFNNNNHLKCRQCGGSIMDSYAFNVHPDVKFHPNCLKCS